MGGSDFWTPLPLGFVSFAQWYPCSALVSLPRAAERGGHGPGGLSIPTPLAGFHFGETSRSPRFLGDPCGRALLSDPGGASAPGLFSASVLPSAIRTASASATIKLSGLHHTAHPLAVYASRPRSPMAAQDSLPAGDQPWPGGTAYPQGPSQRFPRCRWLRHHIPLCQAYPGAL